MQKSKNWIEIGKKHGCKLAVILAFLLIISGMMTGCDLLFGRNIRAGSGSWSSTYTLGESGARSGHPAWFTALGLEPGNSIDVYIKVFKDEDRSHVPSTGGNAGTFYDILGDEGSVTRLVENGAFITNVVNINGAQLNDENYEGGLLFLMMVVDTENGNIHTYSGVNPAALLKGGNSVTIALGTGYQIGQIGPAGGWVFYKDGSTYYEAAPTDVSVLIDGEVSDTFVWGMEGEDAGSTESAIGKGETNTAAIINSFTSFINENKTAWSNNHSFNYDTDYPLGNHVPIQTYNEADPNKWDFTDLYAARMCDIYEVNGYMDWFLPSSSKLVRIYDNLHGPDRLIDGGFENATYWSSNQSNSSPYRIAHNYNFSAASGSIVQKSLKHHVRPVRTFSAQESQFAGGTGTSDYPYQVADWYHLNNVRSSLDAYYILVNDLDDHTSGFTREGSGWDPIGDKENPFTGVFEGNGRTIADLFINRTDEDYIGLFAYIGETGSVSHLTLVSTDIIGGDKVGSIVGKNEGTIEICGNEGGSVTGTSRVGGIAGVNNQGSIQACFNTGTVDAVGDYEIAGGITARNNDGIINECYNSGAVTAAGVLSGYAGGIAQFNSGVISHSYNTGTITGNIIAGIVDTSIGNGDAAVIEFCYSIGELVSSNKAGIVFVKEKTTLGYNYFLEGSAGHGIFDDGDDVSEISWSPVGQAEAKSEAEMKTQAAYVGWWPYGDEVVWGINNVDPDDHNDGYPFLLWQGYEHNYPYEIGDNGLAGGLVFYIDEDDTFEWTYLEAAPAGWHGGETDPISKWSNLQENIGGTSRNIGSGASNTEKIISKEYSESAANMAYEAEINGYADWFLPSSSELYEIFVALQREGLGDFSDKVFYWSSSESSENNAYARNFDIEGSGQEGNASKTGTRRVRPIRAF